MLTNFLDHTRYPESLIDSPATGPQSRIFAGAGAKVDVSTGVGLSNSDPIHWLNALQSFHGNGNMPIEKLQELDNAIGILRLEKYIDNSISSEEQTGIKSLVRDCYYWLRPLFPVSFRKYLQRMALRGWDSKAFPAWPVDFTTEKLMDAIWRQLLNAQTPKELPFIWFWPEGQSSCCIMTHDVETALGRDFCGTMMQIEKRHGIYSAFEVVPEQRYEVPEEFLQGIRDNGCEVCLHGLNHDGHLFTSKAVFSERAKKINAYAEKWRAVGFRSPVMYRNLSWLPELRFSYDMSVPNMAHLDPQHGGCCTVMPYFIGDLLELPLTTTQDYSLFHILQQRSLDLWKKQIAMIQQRYGLVSFIVHPDYVTEKWASELYNDLLAYLSELRSSQGMWIALPRDVADWWKARRQMKLVQQGGAWKIEGPQAERARIAYASLGANGVQFRVEKAQPIAVAR
jgi:hypothetical protein